MECRYYFNIDMKTIEEIEEAIEKLPAQQVEELASWLELFQSKRVPAPDVDNWFQRACGGAIPGVNTANIIAITRGDE